jgi:hypothetical protein
MLKIAVLVFAVAAVGGLIMATRIFQGKKAPWPLSIVHALLGATGLVLVLLNVINGTGSLLLAALIILAVAALGGFYLASFHAGGKLPPKAIVVIHALVAVSGFLLLLGAVFVPASA